MQTAETKWYMCNACFMSVFHVVVFLCTYTLLPSLAADPVSPLPNVCAWVDGKEWLGLANITIHSFQLTNQISLFKILSSDIHGLWVRFGCEYCCLALAALFQQWVEDVTTNSCASNKSIQSRH